MGYGLNATHGSKVFYQQMAQYQCVGQGQIEAIYCAGQLKTVKTSSPQSSEGSRGVRGLPIGEAKGSGGSDTLPKG